MNRTATFLSTLMLAVLLLFVGVIQVKISPVISAVFEGLGIALSGPALLSFIIWNKLPLLAALLLIGVVICYWKASPAWKGSVLPAACLVVSIQLALQIALFINFIAIVPSILARRNFASTAQATGQPSLTLGSTRTPPAMSSELSHPPASSAPLSASAQAGPVSLVR